MDAPPEADKGQIHRDSDAQSNDKGWKEGIKKGNLEWSAGGRVLGPRGGGLV